MNEILSPKLVQKLWKIVFLLELANFVLLGLGLIIAAAIQTVQTNIIGGASWPTFQLKFSMLLSSALGIALAVTFLLSVVTFIGWRSSKK